MKIRKLKDSPLAILLKGYEINMKFPKILISDKKAIIISFLLFYYNITIVKLYTITLTHTHTRLTKTF